MTCGNERQTAVAPASISARWASVTAIVTEGRSSDITFFVIAAVRPAICRPRAARLNPHKQEDTGYAGDINEVQFGGRQSERSLASMAKMVVTDNFERLQAFKLLGVS